ncbi:ABC transporter permease [Saccharopolyspora spinosa]|uniref:Peptide/nickel transport system permease protein n=1 Tax=Saccharopolyspora spinosa TaxID=60894 RepID=A0A2N3XXV7_SACSN|nr:ABC transporter permease [Saccharopolyspora spinosa]PKW15460.1 peptide/nickel transport system permease protein [Saccharopolyspora spinosa]
MTDLRASTSAEAGGSQAIEEVVASAKMPVGRFGFRFGLAIVILAALMAIVGPYIVPHAPDEQDLLARLASPSSTHWLGTDALGRDVFSRLIVAARVDLGVAFLGALFPFILGTVVGGVAAYFGSIWDLAVTRLVDLVLSFPVYVLIISLVAIAGGGVKTLLIVFTIVGWVGYARVVRSTVLRLKNEDFIYAARLGGISHLRILVRHLCPNAIRSSLTLLVTDMMFVLLGLASLSYLGLGIPPPTADWGGMIADAQPYMQQQWWLIAAPGFMIALIGSGLMLIGERLDDR